MAIKTPAKTPTDSFEPSQQQQLNLPPPQTFEILPPLHELLARIDAYQNQGLPPDSSGAHAPTASQSTSVGGPTSTPTLSSATPLPHHPKPSTGTSSLTAAGAAGAQGPTDPADLVDLDSPDFGFAYAEVQPLNPKELPTVALEIKARIRGALRALEKLPDMERGVSEQEEEMRVLEERIRRQRAVLEDLRGVAAGMVGRVG